MAYCCRLYSGITIAISGDGLTRQRWLEAKVDAYTTRSKTGAPIVRCIAGLCPTPFKTDPDP